MQETWDTSLDQIKGMNQQPGAWITCSLTSGQSQKPWPVSPVTAKSLQSCLTLCDPIDSSPLGSPIPGILQARTLEWVAISFPSAWKWKVKVKSLSRVWLLATPWTAAYQALPPMGFSRQEYWSRVPLPSPCKSRDPHRRLDPHWRLHPKIALCKCGQVAILPWPSDSFSEQGEN